MSRPSSAGALHALISAEVGAEPFALFHCSGEGEFFPDGTEDTSGSVVTASGRHFAFWTDWDDEHGRLTLDIWDEYFLADPDQAGSWQDGKEYQDARRRVGLL